MATRETAIRTIVMELALPVPSVFNLTLLSDVVAPSSFSSTATTNASLFHQYPEVAHVFARLELEPSLAIEREDLIHRIQRSSEELLIDLNKGEELSSHRRSALCLFMLIDFIGKTSIASLQTLTLSDRLIPKRQMVRALTTVDYIQKKILESQHLKYLVHPKKLLRYVTELVGEDGDATLDEWLDFTDRLYQRHSGIEIDWNGSNLDDSILENFLSSSIGKKKVQEFKVPKLKSTKAMKSSPAALAKKRKKLLDRKKAKAAHAAMTTTTTTMRIARKKNNVAPVSRKDDTLDSDLFAWIQSLKLSNRSVRKSMSSWRRAFANGYLFAELLLFHYDDVFYRRPAHLRGPQIALSAFDPVVSGIREMEDNWRTLLVCLKRIGIKLKIDDMLVVRIIRAREKAAQTLLEAIYLALLKMNVVPETKFFKFTGSVLLDVSVGPAPKIPKIPKIPKTYSGSPRKRKTTTKKGKGRRNSGEELAFAEIGDMGPQLPKHGIVNVVGIEMFELAETSLTIGSLPDGWDSGW